MPTWFFFVGFVLACIGLLIAFTGRIQIRSVWNPITHAAPSPTMIQSGIFGIARHPIYLGRLLFFIGGMLMYNLFGLVLALVYWWMLRKKAMQEERLLAQNLPGYDRYCQKVNRWF